MDIINRKETKTIIDNFKPNIVINCAAYTNVEKAENEKELADLINHISVDNLAKIIESFTDPLLTSNHDKLAGHLSAYPDACNLPEFTPISIK